MVSVNDGQDNAGKDISADQNGGAVDQMSSDLSDTSDQTLIKLSSESQKSSNLQHDDPPISSFPGCSSGDCGVDMDSVKQARDDLKLQRDLEYSNDDPDTASDGWLDVVGNGQLKKKVLSEGSGGRDSRPRRGQQVTVHVQQVTLAADGSSLSPAVICIDNTGADNTVCFSVGDGQVITALDLAITLMQPGERAELYMASKFAFGERGLLDHGVDSSADLSCIVHLTDVRDEEDIGQMNCQQRLQYGNQVRSRGNWWFQRDEYHHAIQCYRRALDFLDSDSSDNCSEESHTLLQERLKVHNNMAAVQIKMAAYDAALRSIQLVLNCQPDNVKALFRKSKIFSAQNRLSEAESELKHALQVEPNNRALISELISISTLKKRESKAERSLYRSMWGNPQNSAKNKKNNSSFYTRWGRNMLLSGGILVGVAAAMIYKYRLS